jgi:hypothetical protein
LTERRTGSESSRPPQVQAFCKHQASAAMSPRFRLNAGARPKTGSDSAVRRNEAERVYMIEAALNPEVAGSNPAPATPKGAGNGALGVFRLERGAETFARLLPAFRASRFPPTCAASLCCGRGLNRSGCDGTRTHALPPPRHRREVAISIVARATPGRGYDRSQRKPGGRALATASCAPTSSTTTTNARTAGSRSADPNHRKSSYPPAATSTAAIALAASSTSTTELRRKCTLLCHPSGLFRASTTRVARPVCPSGRLAFTRLSAMPAASRCWARRAG